MLLLELCHHALFLLTCCQVPRSPRWFLPTCQILPLTATFSWAPSSFPPSPESALRLPLSFQLISLVWLQLKNPQQSRAQSWWGLGEGTRALGEEEGSWIMDPQVLRKAQDLWQHCWALGLRPRLISPGLELRFAAISTER